MKTRIKAPPNWEDTPQAFERFERLAKALVAVPKKELDKELAKYERQKERRAKQRKAKNGR